MASRRLERGESYLAGGSALNAVIGAARISRDLDFFHDTLEAVNASWSADRKLLESAQYHVHVERERDGLVEAMVSKGEDRVLVEWAVDSAFRFFPLVVHPDLGLTMHPFDLATNKVLALVGRLEVRDWVDVIISHERIQRLGYLAWAASGKDPGFSPSTILDHASRSARYSQIEVSSLKFENEPLDAAELSNKWRAMLEEAREIISMLDPAESGKCVIDLEGRILLSGPDELRHALRSVGVQYHSGSICGSFPRLKPHRA